MVPNLVEAHHHDPEKKNHTYLLGSGHDHATLPACTFPVVVSDNAAFAAQTNHLLIVRPQGRLSWRHQQRRPMAGHRHWMT